VAAAVFVPGFDCPNGHSMLALCAPGFWPLTVGFAVRRRVSWLFQRKMRAPSDVLRHTAEKRLLFGTHSAIFVQSQGSLGRVVLLNIVAPATVGGAEFPGDDTFSAVGFGCILSTVLLQSLNHCAPTRVRV